MMRPPAGTGAGMMSLTNWRAAVFVGGVVVASATLAEGQGVPQSVPPPAAPPATQAPRPPTPTRDPRTPGYVTATSATESARRRGAARRQVRKLHPRSHASSGSRDDRQRRRAPRRRAHVHDGVDREQDLSRDRAHARHPLDGRSGRPRETHREQRSCSATRDVSPSTSRSSTCPARSPRSSSEPTDPISCCSRPWTI